MKGEILSIETVQKIAQRDNALKYIDSILKNAYIGTLKNGVRYRLSYDAVMELQTIENILKGKEEIK